MISVTAFQKLELILIPTIFIFSQILILLFGLSILGEEIWIIMGTPMMLGAILSVIASIIILNYFQMVEFRQLEIIFRVLAILGGIAIIFVIIIQIVLADSGYVIFSLQTLIISVIGDIMTILCILFLKKTFPTQELSE
ncbi:MAG: hypothetical protein ACTSQH_03800 [Candidatus Hodarchaeales archaeon]